MLSSEAYAVAVLLFPVGCWSQASHLDVELSENACKPSQQNMCNDTATGRGETRLSRVAEWESGVRLAKGIHSVW